MKYIICLLFLVSCGYSRGGSELAETYGSLSIPYVKGDSNGRFTDALTRAMGELGEFSLLSDGGALRMDVAIVGDQFEQIGYQHDQSPTKFNDPKTRLVPNEERRKLSVEVTLVEVATAKVVFGPKVISAEADYDFVNADSIQDTITDQPGAPSVLSFSLGQLDSKEGAREGALVSVQRALAKKIAYGMSGVKVTP